MRQVKDIVESQTPAEQMSDNDHSRFRGNRPCQRSWNYFTMLINVHGYRNQAVGFDDAYHIRHGQRRQEHFATPW